jgi:hypothetical protein
VRGIREVEASLTLPPSIKGKEGILKARYLGYTESANRGFESRMKGRLSTPREGKVNEFVLKRGERKN